MNSLKIRYWDNFDQQLRKDVEELTKFEAQAERKYVKEQLQIAKHKVELEIVNLELKQKQKAQKVESAAAAATSQPKRWVRTKFLEFLNGIWSRLSSSKLAWLTILFSLIRYSVELNEYAFDQSDKFVKLFVTLKDSQKLQDSDVVTNFTLHSMCLTVNNLNNKDYTLVIKNLLHEINLEKSYFKIKTDMIAIYLKKQKEGQNWEHLTSIEKKLKDAKDSSFKKDKDMDADPTSGLMNLMKKMYDEGDSSTKQMIAKTWSESMNKQQQPGPDF